MLVLIPLLLVGVFVPWGVLFFLWRWLRTDAVPRLRRARLIVAGLGAVAVLFAFLRHDTSGAVVTALMTLLLIAVLSGWLRRVLHWVAIVLFVFTACAGWFAFGSIRGVMAPGASALLWVSVALTTMLTWLLLGGAILCMWLSRRPVVPIGTPAPPPPAPSPPTPRG